MEKNLVTKAGMTEYLKGAKEIERDIYTLERMEAELKKQSNDDRLAMQKVREGKKREEQGKQACIDRIDDYNADLESPFERLLKKRYYLLGTDNRHYNYTAEDRSFTTIWKYAAIIALVIGVIIGVIIDANSSKLNLNSELWDDWLYVSFAVLELVGLVVAIIIWSPLRREIKEAHKENRKNRKKNKKTIRE